MGFPWEWDFPRHVACVSPSFVQHLNEQWRWLCRVLWAAPSSTAWSEASSSVILARSPPRALATEAQVILGSKCPLKPHGQERWEGDIREPQLWERQVSGVQGTACKNNWLPRFPCWMEQVCQEIKLGLFDLVCLVIREKSLIWDILSFPFLLLWSSKITVADLSPCVLSFSFIHSWIFLTSSYMLFTSLNTFSTLHVHSWEWTFSE